MTSQLDTKPSTGLSEIKQLSEHFKFLSTDLSNKENKLSEEHKKIDTIFSLQYDMDNPPSVEKFFRQALGVIQEVTGYNTITMRSYEATTQTFRIMAQSGMSLKMVKDLETIHISQGFHAEVALDHWPAYTSDMLNDPRMTSTAPVSEGYKSLICIPLLAQNILVGTVQIAIKEIHLWGADEVRWLALLGRRIGLLVHQIQLTERLRDMAVLEERARISQEIHDGLAQLIGSMRLWSEEAIFSLEDNEIDVAKKSINKIELAARDAYASLRDEMLGLRETVFPNKDLSSVIAEYLNRFQRQWGLKTKFIIEDSARNNIPWPIAPSAEIQLLRIIQEGLTNIRRHANASTIFVTISSNNGSLQVQLRDDGIGFNIKNIPEDRLGLHIMRERIASIGGSIIVSSEIGVGTALEIDIPLRTSQNIQRGEQ